MIQGIFAQSANAFRGAQGSLGPMEDFPSSLHVAQNAKIPIGACTDYDTQQCDWSSWPDFCNKDPVANQGCSKTCIERHNDNRLTLNVAPECSRSEPTEAPATAAPPATTAPSVTVTPTEPPAATTAPSVTVAPVPCVPAPDIQTEAPPATVAPPATDAPVSPGDFEGYVPINPPAMNNSQNYMFSSFASGQSGNASYATMMGVSPQELVGGVMPYNDLENQKKSDCMWCDNLWQSVWNPQETGPVLNGNGSSYKTHTEFRNKTPTKMNYKDYSASSAQDDYIVGAYVTEWSIYRAKGKYGIDAVPFNSALDYVLYGFMPVCGRGSDDLGQLGLCTVQDCTSYQAESNSYFALNQACEGMEPGTVVIHDPWSAFSGYGSMMKQLEESGYPNFMGGFHLLMNAKAEHKEKIRIMPSVGGWSLSKIFFDMHDERIRHNFVNSAANLLTAWPFFDGIDIDWEFPGGYGADAGIVKFATGAESEVTSESWSPQWDNLEICSQQKVEETERPRTIYTSWNNLRICNRFTTSGVETIDIPPLGCSHTKAKRQEIADNYKSWGTYGTKSKEQFMNCKCDADIGYMLFSDLRIALDSVPLDERPIEFGKIDRYQITTATSGAPDKINEVDYGRLVAEGKLDHIFIMSYDFMGAWDMEHLGHQTNLFPHKDGTATPVSISGSVQAFLNQGVPSNKIMVGVASYGRGWKGDFSEVYNNSNLAAAWTATADAACSGDIEDGVVDYNTIYEKTESGSMNQLWDDCAMAHLTVGPTEIYTGDSAESVWAKGDFVRRNNLAGLFTWELSQDSHQAPLINVMNEALGRVPSSGSVQKPESQYSDISSSKCNTTLDHVNYSERIFGINCEK